jgi:molecular chaperone Hsp33
MTHPDVLHRYLFDNLHARGELVQLSKSYQQTLAHHDYPQGVRILLGELMAVTCLLTATLKFEGEITVQLQGHEDSPVAYMSINGNHKQDMRGIARVKENTEVSGLQHLIGKGNMVITIRPKNAEAYQGVVALEKETLAECLAHYFEVSEQISTKIWLFSDDENQQVAGSLIQSLPANDEAEDSEQKQADFEHLCQLTNTIKAEEIFTLEAETLLYRLYHQEKVRIFDPQAVTFVCGCSSEKCLTAIVQIKPSEIKSIIEEQGHISMTCEYCLTTYTLDEQQIACYMNEVKH